MKTNLVIREGYGAYYWEADAEATPINEAIALFRLGRRSIHVLINPTASSVRVNFVMDDPSFAPRKKIFMGLGRIFERISIFLLNLSSVLRPRG